ncbi:MAG TPA: hypothetical protein VHB47_05940 [Thermoanaerobaculia bacterium]|nr:hypothetical protein [Thermoanaerobaculia bacterium]
MSLKDRLRKEAEYLQGARAVQAGHPSVRRIRERLNLIKSDAIRRQNERIANMVWCYETILDVQEKYWDAFRCLKAARYYEAWCLYEQVEIALNSLSRHFTETNDEFKLGFVARQVQRFQQLFPYKLFTSAGLLYKRIECSICGKPSGLRRHCSHEAGQLYGGQLCCRVIRELSLLEVSFVEHPINKYAVPFVKESDGEQRDHYDYTLVFYVASALANPFHAWDLQWTKRRQPHSRFADVQPDEKCPCGADRIYSECCLLEAGVLRPHAEITFSIPPKQGLPPTVYTGDIAARAGTLKPRKR